MFGDTVSEFSGRSKASFRSSKFTKSSRAPMRKLGKTAEHSLYRATVHYGLTRIRIRCGR